MELKEIGGIITIKVGEFQSHLYGIESVSRSTNGAHTGVSIAPLWN